MCTGFEIAALAGTALSAGMSADAANRRDDQDAQDAANEKDMYKAQAENLSRARRKQAAAARAATAAAGTRLDEFSEINTSDIEREGARDESMTLLSGERKSASMLYGQGNGARAATLNGVGDLLSTGYQVGWKGKKGSA